MFAKITGTERKEVQMVDEIAMREAIVNTLVHNDWASENPPKFEIFSNHLSVSSSGGLPFGFTQEKFLIGFSAPRHPELMRVFKDMGLVEQLGTGILRILKTYNKDVFEFYPNFIRINFKYRNLSDEHNTRSDTRSDTISDKVKLTEIQNQIISLILKTPDITQN